MSVEAKQAILDFMLKKKGKTRFYFNELCKAVPDMKMRQAKIIINELVNLPVYVRTVPKFTEILQGKASVEQIQDIELEDLLGRDPVPPHPELIDRCITGKVVMVTGAGGPVSSGPSSAMKW